MQICFFGDSIEKKLHPLTLTRPADELRVGILKIWEKWAHVLSNPALTRLLPIYMKDVFPAPAINSEQPCLWVNNRFLPTIELQKEMANLKPGRGLTKDSHPVVICLNGAESKRLFDSGFFIYNEITFKETEAGSLLNNAWDVFVMNDAEIKNDISLLNLAKTNPMAGFHGVHFLGDAFYIHETAEIEPGCFLDSRNGPIYIGEGAHLMAGSLLKGSIAICDHATTKMGAKIYDGTTVGPHSKVGGEVQNVVFQGYCNKAHDGFLGNSAIGEWCNFGADTNNSNLKNNYSTVRIVDWKTRKEIETGLQFCGLIMGDHSKTAINTALNTGTVCGVSSNLFTQSFPQKLIPSFKWVGNDDIQNYKLDKAIETMKIVMKRRKVEMSDAYEKMMTSLFDKEN